MSNSEFWRDRGNVLLKADKPDMNLDERQIKLKMVRKKIAFKLFNNIVLMEKILYSVIFQAQSCYLKAIECASNNDEIASAAKNAGTVSNILSGLYKSDDAEQVQVIV